MPWEKKRSYPGGLKGRENLLRQVGLKALAAFQAAPLCHPSTQGIGLRPQPWARVSRPAGPVVGPSVLRR